MKQAIHKLAKRQETYFRGMARRGIPITWINEANEAQALHIIEQHWEHDENHNALPWK
ncbi:hypothetical protein ACFL27_25715 [candidate division CSSED10-310 bacterium]|uniref:Antitoxin n=1 Tax=candidate division CSSED10-310 bacterium TaxID=2855610 RepID=A0ABV6Z577_UNCC1